MTINIAIINHSTAVADKDVSPVVAALQRQVSEHFAPIWGVNATLVIFGKDAAPPPNFWQLILLDDSDQASALGYHMTTANGLPLGKVFARTCQQDGESWTVCASHELLEMICDPEINLTVFVQQGDGTGTLTAYEIADPVEGATYMIDGVQMSDFVLPAYFEPGTVGATPSAPFDHLGQLTAPMPAMLPGGYLSVFQVGQGGSWQQITDMRAHPHRMMPAEGSRRHRRMLPRALWRRSQTP